MGVGCDCIPNKFKEPNENHNQTKKESNLLPRIITRMSEVRGEDTPATATESLYVPLWSRLTLFKSNVAGSVALIFLKGLFESIVEVSPFKIMSGVTTSNPRVSLKNHCLKPTITPKSYVHTSETSDPLAT